MEKYVAEFLGTFLLVLLGDGVVAGVVLNKTKSNNSGWLVITTGWAFGVVIGVYAVGWISGAHINPAVTIGLAFVGKISWALVPGYVIAQTLGAFVAGIWVYVIYKNHFDATEDPGLKLAVFSTGPAIPNKTSNFLAEMTGTFVLVLGVMMLFFSKNDLGAMGPFMIGVVVWGIGLSLGGLTGYAINPARDLGPRIAHALLPIQGKGNSDWGYSWIPVAGPIVGGILGAWVYNMMM